MEPFGLEFTNDREEMGNQLELMCFQKRTQATDYRESMVLRKVSAKALIDQDAAVVVR